MNRKILLLLLIYILGFVFVEAKEKYNNPLGEFISNNVYYEGKKRFQSYYKRDADGKIVLNRKGKKITIYQNNIFEEKVYSIAAAEKDRIDMIRDVTQRFTEVIVVAKKGKTWLATFYYKDDNGTIKRKTVEGNQKMSFGSYKSRSGKDLYKYNYIVIPEENGITIKDIKTGYKATINKKGR